MRSKLRELNCHLFSIPTSANCLLTSIFIIFYGNEDRHQKKAHCCDNDTTTRHQNKAC